MPTALFSTAYFAPVQYYWHWNRHPERMMESSEHFLKQTWRNRCNIGTANGPMALTIPVEGGAEKKPIREVRISDHNDWPRMHWYSIESAYNSSPFFEYYADDLHPFFENRYDFLFDFNEALREKMCELLELSAEAQLTSSYVHETELPEDCLDFRNLISPKKDFSTADPDFEAKTYYQVFERKFGFQPNLSILDLLFNMGPESILYL